MIHELLNEFMTDDPGDKLSDGVIFIVKLERMYSARIIRLQHHRRLLSLVVQSSHKPQCSVHV